MSKIPKVLKRGIVKFKDTEVDVAVLADGTRVIIGDGTRKDVFLGVMPSYIATYKAQAQDLTQFMDIEDSMIVPIIEFENLDGTDGVGYNHIVIAEIADSYQKYKANLIKDGKPIPEGFAEAIEFSERLMLNLAYIGINALVDEATGYQQVRSNTDLQDSLDKRTTATSKQPSIQTVN
jgi:hypothetical protein